MRAGEADMQSGEARNTALTAADLCTAAPSIENDRPVEPVEASHSLPPQCLHNRGHHTQPLPLRAREPNKAAVKTYAM